MYNNPQQHNPYMYNYGAPGYQRMIPPQQMEASTLPPSQSYPAPMMMQQVNYIKGRPVVSIDEARASQIDLDGSLYVFPDLGNKKIYTKQINMDGTAAFNVFELSAAADQGITTPAYVTRDELDQILTSFKASLIQDKPNEPGSAPKVNKTFNL